MRWATATTYKWQCVCSQTLSRGTSLTGYEQCGGKNNTCGISNTTDQNDRFPRCSGQACNHLKCAKCTDLKDTLEEVGELGGVSEPGSALPAVDSGAMWYCVGVVAVFGVCIADDITVPVWCTKQ